jgi:CheY-like chemotaxis protein
VAHDFNNILGVINGYSEILLEDKDFPESYREAVGEILSAGHRAASLTRQLLAFSRKLVLKPQVLSFNTIIENFDKMLRRLIGEEIEVKTELEADLYQVKADPSQMEQVLLNFCINARDAMPEGGRITIRTENVDVDQMMAAQHPGLSPGCFVKLSVSDTGIGMDKETVARVFEPFFTTKGPERGTGLGLATVYGIVKQSGGHVTVYSEPGEGSVFSVYLPIAAEQTQVREQPKAMQELKGGTETIMLVEDEPALRLLYRKILEDKGYTVVEAEDGERAIQVAERYSGTISLLLSDVSLPKLKGPVMAKILQQQRPELKVLFISGHSGDILAGPDKVVPAGTDFLQKPFRTDDLLRKLRQMLDSREGASVWAA